jgi:MFS family permease
VRGAVRMNPRERQAWIIAASLFVTLFLVWGGGVNTGPVFLPPLLKYFGWTRARVSTLGSAGALMAGACGPLVGWLLDRIDARRVMEVDLNIKLGPENLCAVALSML